MQILNNISQLFGLIAFVALIWLVVLAFRRRIWWGLGVMFLSPITAIIFAVKYWDEVKKPFLIYIISLVSSIAIGLYLFTAWGGWQMVKSSKNVAEGIWQETLTEEDAMQFMKSGMDFLENSAASEKDKQIVALQRKILDMFQSEPTDNERFELNQDFLNLLKRSDLTEEEKQQLEELRLSLLVQSDLSEKGQQKLEEIRGKIERQDLETDPKTLQFKAIQLAQAKEYIGRPVLLTGRDGVEKECRLIGVSGSTFQFQRRIGGGSISFDFRDDEIQSLKVLKH
jgi:hypothetical protein